MPIPESLRKWRAEHPNWREEGTFGQRIIKEIDCNGDVLTPEQHQKLLEINNGEELARILYADLSDALKPDIKKGMEYFGPLADRPYELPAIVLSLRFFTIGQFMLIIDDARRAVKAVKATKDERREATKLAYAATKDMHICVTMVERLAATLGAMKPKPEQSAPECVNSSEALAPELE